MDPQACSNVGIPIKEKREMKGIEKQSTNRIGVRFGDGACPADELDSSACLFVPYFNDFCSKVMRGLELTVSQRVLTWPLGGWCVVYEELFYEAVVLVRRCCSRR
jgi:hypothetical protein